MKLETYKCDIYECQNEAKRLNLTIQVIFITETNEGRPTDPYLEIVDLDMCDNCFNELLKSKKYIVAEGAMGYNDYRLSK